MVGDGERVAISSIAELELALEVGAPQVVGASPSDSGVPRARWRGPPPRLTRPWRSRTAWMVPFGRNPDVPVEPSYQELADLACAPMRLLAFEANDQALDLLGQLVGVAHGPSRAVGEGFNPVLLVAAENLVAVL